MSDDPVTQSIMPEGFNESLEQSAKKKSSLPKEPNTSEQPPAVIDLSSLDDYPVDAVKQCVLDTRIKISRINEEMNQLHKTIERARADMNVCLGRSRFYQIVRNQLTRYLEEIEKCPTSN